MKAQVDTGVKTWKDLGGSAVKGRGVRRGEWSGLLDGQESSSSFWCGTTGPHLTPSEVI